MYKLSVGLNPIFWSSVLLLIKNINELRQENEIYFFKETPVQLVRIAGFVVGIIRKSDRLVFDVDDGTGVVVCIDWSVDDYSSIDLDLGDIISVQGKLTQFHTNIQVLVNHYTKITVLEEAIHKAKAVYLADKVYSKRFKIDNELLDKVENKPSEVKTKLDPAIQKTILRHFYTPQKFRELCKNPDLKKELLNSMSQTQYETQIAKIISQLVKDGVLYQLDPVEDIYERVNLSNLGQNILGILKRETLKLKQPSSGVSLDELLIYIRMEMEKFKFVPRNVVIGIIRELSGKGLVSEISKLLFVAY